MTTKETELVEALVALCAIHRPEHAVIADPALFAALRDGLAAAGLTTQAHAGHEAITALAGSDACDTVVAATMTLGRPCPCRRREWTSGVSGFGHGGRAQGRV